MNTIFLYWLNIFFIGDTTKLSQHIRESGCNCHKFTPSYELPCHTLYETVKFITQWKLKTNGINRLKCYAYAVLTVSLKNSMKYFKCVTEPVTVKIGIVMCANKT